MSAPRIKFKDEINFGMSSTKEDETLFPSIISSKNSTMNRVMQKNDFHFDDSSLRMRRECLESRIQSHFRRNLKYRYPARLPSFQQKKDIYFSDHEDEVSDSDGPANYVHVSTIGEIQPSETLSDSPRSHRSVSRRESLKSNSSKDDINSISCTTVNRTFAIGAPWKPKFRPSERSIYYSNDGNKVD